MQVDAHESRRNKAEDGKGAESTAYGRFAGKASSPPFVLRAFFEVAAGVGDGNKVGCHVFCGHALFEIRKNSVKHAAHFDGAARFARNKNESFV